MPNAIYAWGAYVNDQEPKRILNFIKILVSHKNFKNVFREYVYIKDHFFEIWDSSSRLTCTCICGIIFYVDIHV